MKNSFIYMSIKKDLAPAITKTLTLVQPDNTKKFCYALCIDVLKYHTGNLLLKVRIKKEYMLQMTHKYDTKCAMLQCYRFTQLPHVTRYGLGIHYCPTLSD